MLLGNNLVHKTHYDILGVREDANYEEIRISYRSSILDSHPDKLQKAPEADFPNQDLENRFLAVQRAWEILSDSNSRVAYDSELRALRQEFIAADDIGLEDLMVQSTGDVLELFYQCRCGDYYTIDSSELEEMGYQLQRDGSKISLCASDALHSSVLLSCGSCSLRVRMLMNAESKIQT
ncbi:DPH4 like [Actinidia chinensis var. chinensis]|uniref:DPH4 like n=1 Tax=Actinidia chinensis var. chinensis TaxID=1590841 RepID=A0A2R6RN34_ACTCC|nr:DPH4 like [Actinidia chinensis var. chinensis]